MIDPLSAALLHVRQTIKAAGIDVDVVIGTAADEDTHPMVLVQDYDTRIMSFNGPEESHGVSRLLVRVVDESKYPTAAIALYAQIHEALQGSTGTNQYGDVRSCARMRSMNTPTRESGTVFQYVGGEYELICS